MSPATRLRPLALAAAIIAAATFAAPGPAAAATGQPGVIAVIGDFGSGAPAEGEVARMIARLRPGTVVTTGDNVYASAGYAALVGAYYRPWVTAQRLFPATGNHDYAEGISNFDTYFTWLKGRRTYATTVGDITFFVLDSQAALDSPTELARQRTWLKSALKTSGARWRVVVLHHPPYSSGTVHGSTRAFQWPYGSWGADLVLAGHEHNYERLVEAGLTYVVDGAGGKDLYRLGSPLPGSTARDDVHYGALVLRPSRTTLRGEFRTASGRVVDRFTLHR